MQREQDPLDYLITAGDLVAYVKQHGLENLAIEGGFNPGSETGTAED